MAEENITPVAKDGEITPDKGVKTADNPTPEVKSAQPEITQEEKARREAQGKRDKAVSEVDQLREQNEQLLPFAYKAAQKEAISEFLTANKEKYPNVSEQDLVPYGVLDPQELQTAADIVEGIYKKAEQKALEKIQDVPEDADLTPEQQTKELAEMDKKTEYDPNMFQRFIKIKGGKRFR